jgi:hypothetical protein
MINKKDSTLIKICIQKNLHFDNKFKVNLGISITECMLDL